ncbi:bobby sox [Haematobia irritans]|uniref:bobby sox n=1 Tax=Haematobia irritans TaxID=7368 RepID=UPI003F50814A
MLNSVNTLEFLKPKLIIMDKFNSTSAAKIHHQTSHTPTSRTYYTFVRNADDKMKTTLMIGEQSLPLTQQSPLRHERVKVQHLENHTKLQNNSCWNAFGTFLSTTSACAPLGDGGVDNTGAPHDIKYDCTNEALDMKHTIDIQNKSAFNLEINKRIYSNIKNINSNKNSHDDSKSTLSTVETNNNHFYFKNQQQQQNGFINKQSTQKSMMIILPQRTEDQEHAYRRIESVHNYAKLKTDNQSPNGSRRHSFDEEYDDEEEEDDAEDDNNDADYDVEEDDLIDLDGDYEDIFNRRKFAKLSNSSSHGSVISTKLAKANKCLTSQTVTPSSTHNADEDSELQVDVETVESQVVNTSAMNVNVNDSSLVKPDHHARRPMNAFLIFCKRHRAIVKERYKTLENRAITKILGDWWASLDANDKTSFTVLAQQNKDAFFSANPNFKWYKLPAPPLRTLSTRPITVGSCENEGSSFGSPIVDSESICNNTRSSTNYFKLADEAQMGDLSQLIQDKNITKQCALQEALGETSQFMRSHITGSVEEEKPLADEKLLEHLQLKRRYYNENSFSSNSSEEDALLPKKKSARSCKGKIYQELINSGQIAAPAIKKSKSSQRVAIAEVNNRNPPSVDIREIKLCKEEPTKQDKLAIDSKFIEQKSSTGIESLESYDFANFDLEEKIKDLPALSLDDYLQRKRNTKKKRKYPLNAKKRGNRNNNNLNGANGCTNNQDDVAFNVSPPQPLSPTTATTIIQQRKQQQQAVGSQKRKARKESITRRDVSAIEQEVTSLMPLTINGCCYFQEAPLSPVITSYKNMKSEKDPQEHSPTNSTVDYFNPTSPIIPLMTSSFPPQASPSLPSRTTLLESTAPEEMENKHNLNDNTISSTSDLLILAEVAANRTEINK